MTIRPTVLIVGLGELGGLLLELLVRMPEFSGRIVAADVDKDAGWRRVNSARQGALMWGRPADVTFVSCDLTDIDRTAEMIASAAPDVVVNCTTIATWWLRDLLPSKVKERLHAIGAGSGLWSAGHAALAYKLMRSIKATGQKPFVVNSAYPDAVNVALWKCGLGPQLGIGNGDLLVAPLRQLAAEHFGVSQQRIGVTLVAHHFHAYNVLMHGSTRGLDFYLRLALDGADVTDKFDRAEFLAAVPVKCGIPAAAAATWIVAASALRTVKAVLTGSGEVVHAPGPIGLVGGYPVTVHPEVTVALPAGLDKASAAAINERAQRAEGIDGFEDDGTIILGDVAVHTLKEVFDFECSRYPLAECYEIARELGARLRELGARHGVALKVH